jgi:nucleoside-triphosphatase THEP1
VILAGTIGAGKTRAAEDLAASLKARGISIGGVLAPRLLRGEETIGYAVRDLLTGEERPYASLEPPGVPIGRFFLREEGLGFARDAIARAGRAAKVVFVDEVGRLELADGGLASAVRDLLSLPVLSVLLVRSDFVEHVAHTFSLSRFEVISVCEKRRAAAGEG